MDYINSIIESINRENTFCIFVGDFIIDLLKVDTHADSEFFINSLGSCFFQSQIFQPTRITERDYSNFSETALLDDISSVDWQFLFQGERDPSRMFDSFYKELTRIVDKNIPIKQLSRRELKSYSKPWITCAIKTSIRRKNALYRKYLKTKSAYYHCKFKCYRNMLNHLLKDSKRLYYNNNFLENINNSKNIWNGIKEIVHLKAKINQKTVKIVQNETELTDPKLVANAFNNYFANVGVNLLV